MQRNEEAKRRVFLISWNESGLAKHLLGSEKHLNSLSICQVSKREWKKKKAIHRERVEETQNVESDPVSGITSQDLMQHSSEACGAGSWIQTLEFNNPTRWILHSFVFILQAYLCIWTPQLPVTMSYRKRAWQKKSSPYLCLKFVTPKIHWVLDLIGRGSCSLSPTSSRFRNLQIYFTI